MRKPVSLRSTLVTLTILVTALAVLVSGALVTLTTMIHRTAENIASSVDSVRLAQGAELDLLLLDRVRDGVVRRELEGDLRQRLLEAKRFVTTDHEAQTLAEAERRVDAYILGTRDPRRSAADGVAQQETAYGALEALVTINAAQSKAAQLEAARWDSLGNILGIGIGALLIVIAGALLLWLKGRAFEAVFGLAAAMERFGSGDREARAAERGPLELRAMCARFNEMASAIAAQRQAQIAFLGGVAHDLRNPLSALRMSVARLGPGSRKLSEEGLRQTIDRIDRQIMRMERMLGDFLDIAKIEAGQLDLRLDTHDARRLVEEVVAFFEGTASEHRLEVRVPDGELLIECDHLRMEQVITNLISNAIKYSPSGSLVEIVLESHGDELKLSVADYGVGISGEDRARVFDPFRRVGLSKESVPGVGLGLFVVRKIVEAHQGRIEVASTPGKGSTFRVFLPMKHDHLERRIIPERDVPEPLH